MKEGDSRPADVGAYEPRRGTAIDEPAATKSTSDEGDTPSSSSDPSSSSSSIVVIPAPMTAPLVSLRHGRQQKKSGLEPQNWVKLALTLDGRDKLTKLLQYACRTLSWWYATVGRGRSSSSSSNYYAIQAERFAAAKVALTNGRKAFRLGRTFIELHRLHAMVVARTSKAAKTIPKPSTSATSSSKDQASMACSPSIKSSLISTLVSYTSRPGSWFDPCMSALKLLGLAGFWGADNVSYLAQSGLLDDYSQSKEDRIRRRSQLQATYSAVANRSYFVGAVAGLVVNWRAYWRHRTTVLLPLLVEQQQQQQELDDKRDEGGTCSELSRRIDLAHQKQFVNGTALIKSCCDVLVFSNNPGVDLWRKGYLRGNPLRRRRSENGLNPPMHEGLHCLCGLLSAATVLYNNFPDDDTNV